MRKQVLKRKKSKNDIHTVILYDNYVVNRFPERHSIKPIIRAYSLLKNNGLIVPKLIKCDLEANILIQEKIINEDNHDLGKIIQDVCLLHSKSKINFDNLFKFQSIRKLDFLRKNEKNIGEFLISFFVEIKKKDGLKPFLEDELKSLINELNNNKKSFEDRYICFIHGDLDFSNILVNKIGTHYYIDYENSGFFDYYYDFALLYIQKKEKFIEEADKLGINIDMNRLLINVNIYKLLEKIYN